MASEQEDSCISIEHDIESFQSHDDDLSGQEPSGDRSEEPRSTTPKTRFANLYCLDLKKCDGENFDDITNSLAETVKCTKAQKKDVSCTGSQHFEKGIKWTFTTEQPVLTASQEEAEIGTKKDAFSITYFETKDKQQIYVAGNGSSYHYLKNVTDHEFPEWVLDKNLEDDALEIHGKGLHGRIAIFSEKFRQEHSQMENLWVHMNSLTTKLKVPVRTDSELGRVVCQKGKKVFVDVNFENNSVQVKKKMDTDEVLEVLDALVSSLKNSASRQCAQLRLVSRVRDTSMQKKLDEELNALLERRYGEHSPAAVGKGATVLSRDQESECLVLHAYDDQWNEASEIVLKVCDKKQAPSEASQKVKKTRQPMTKYQPHEETTGLFVELHKHFRATRSSNFFQWLGNVDAVYGKKKKKLLSLMECRFPFLLDNTCHMYFHGQWLTFSSDFHSHLEVHFLELMKTRSIEPSLILPLAWPKTKDQIQTSEYDFARFLATWLEMKTPTDGTCSEIQGKEPYKNLIKCLSSDNMIEPQYNEMYALVGQLMDNSSERGFIVGDGVTLKGGLELFDLLYYDSKRIFLIHVKRGFSASNMRIVVDQVRQSAEFIQCLTYRGEKASLEELKSFFGQLKYCNKSDGKCRRHGDKRWICEATLACTKEVNASNFIDLLKSHEKHFVLAYGGTEFTKTQLDEITGRKVDDVLQKHHRWVGALASNGYVKQLAGDEDGPGKHVVTSRFCVETEENFVKCMKGDEEEMTDRGLLVLFKGLKGAISKTETSAGKMAFLNLFGTFSNYQNLKLHFCRIDHKFPGQEAMEELIALFETLHL